MECPNCHSDQTCRCADAVASGGRVAGARTEIECADLAHDAAPPCSGFRAALPALCVAAVLNVVALVGTWALVPGGREAGLARAWLRHEPATLRWVLLVVLAAALVYLLAACRSLPKDRAARARWGQLWICRGCGSKFLPEQGA